MNNNHNMKFSIKREVKDINRLREILTILIEEGFGYFLSQLRLKHPKLFLTKISRKNTIDTIPERLVTTLERLGPTFIKFGQLLSVRPDLVPKEYIRALERLQDKVKPEPYDQVEETLRREYKKSLNEIFSSFNKNPIASASISQVYEAKLKNGDRVAVKVLRPGVREKFEKDLDIMFYMAELIEKYIPTSKRYSPTNIVLEFAKWTIKEIDFRNEAKNARRFKRNFQNSKIVYIPKVYDEFTTKKVLVEEFIDGIEMHDYFKSKRKKQEVIKIINRGLDAALTQVFVNGFFHADPHPGNILIMKNHTLCFIDFGIVGYFNEHLKSLTLDLMYGIVEKDYNKIADACIQICNGEKENFDNESFKNDLIEIFDPLQDKSIDEVKISKSFEKLFELLLDYHLKPDYSFVIFGKTLMELEGIALRYDNNLKVIKQIKPFIEHLIKIKIQPKNIALSIYNEARELISFAKKLPRETENALKKIKEGTIKVDINETELKRLSLEIDRSSNRITYGVLISSLLITGALMIDIGTPKYLNIPLFSFFMFILASVLFFILLISIINEKRLNA